MSSHGKGSLSCLETRSDNAADENDAVHAAIDDDATSDAACADVDAYFEGCNNCNMLAGYRSIASNALICIFFCATRSRTRTLTHCCNHDYLMMILIFLCSC